MTQAAADVERPFFRGDHHAVDRWPTDDHRHAQLDRLAPVGGNRRDEDLERALAHPRDLPVGVPDPATRTRDAERNRQLRTVRAEGTDGERCGLAGQDFYPRRLGRDARDDLCSQGLGSRAARNDGEGDLDTHGGADRTIADPGAGRVLHGFLRAAAESLTNRDLLLSQRAGRVRAGGAYGR